MKVIIVPLYSDKLKLNNIHEQNHKKDIVATRFLNRIKNAPSLGAIITAYLFIVAATDMSSLKGLDVFCCLNAIDMSSLKGLNAKFMP